MACCGVALAVGHYTLLLQKKDSVVTISATMSSGDLVRNTVFSGLRLLVVDVLDFDHVRKPSQTVQPVQTLELASSNFLGFFGSFHVGKVKLLLQAFELTWRTPTHAPTSPVFYLSQKCIRIEAIATDCFTLSLRSVENLD